MLKILLGVVTFALWVFCLVEAISSQEGRIRNLPKVAWIVIVLFFPFVGSVAWLVAGRPQAPVRPAGPTSMTHPDYDARPGRFVAQDPEKDAEFLRQVRERAEEQRRRYEASKKPPPEPEEPSPGS